MTRILMSTYIHASIAMVVPAAHPLGSLLSSLGINLSSLVGLNCRMLPFIVANLPS